MTFMTKALISLSLIFVFTVLTGIAATFYFNSDLKEKLNFSTAESLKYLPKVLEDLKVIDQAKVILPITFTKNAEPLVSKHVAWHDSGSDAVPASIALFQKHSDFSKTDEAYQRLTQDPDFKELETDWIEDLESYDHLDLTTNRRVKTQLDRIEGLGGIDRIQVHSTLPLISFMDLINQATIFSIKKSNLRRLHNVAQLLVSNPSLVAQMSAIVALRREFFLSQKLGIIQTPGLNEELINRMRRLGFAWPGILSLHETDSLPNEIRHYMKPEMMVCGAAGEIPFPVMLSDFLEPRWPFESSFKERLELSRTFYSLMADIRHSKPYLVYLKPIESSFFLFDWKTQNIPYVRRVVSNILMSIGQPNFMSQYVEREKSNSQLDEE